jgi:hypothetical protein
MILTLVTGLSLDAGLSRVREHSTGWAIRDTGERQYTSTTGKAGP